MILLYTMEWTWSVILSVLIPWCLIGYMYHSAKLPGKSNTWYSNADFSIPLYQYVMDIIYVSWAVHWIGLFSTVGWWLYLLIPFTVVYKILKMFRNK